jgi:hypothetical protein
LQYQSRLLLHHDHHQQCHLAQAAFPPACNNKVAFSYIMLIINSVTLLRLHFLQLATTRSSSQGRFHSSTSPVSSKPPPLFLMESVIISTSRSMVKGIVS